MMYQVYLRVLFSNLVQPSHKQECIDRLKLVFQIRVRAGGRVSFIVPSSSYRNP